MPAEQLRLFPVSKPLAERFGKSFFRRVPRQPGVYQMRGGEDRLLYVGQSKNLRQRLLSYKNAHPDKVSGKVTRLVHSIDAIEWEQCPSAELARLKENALLRTHRPPFNVLNTYPRAYSFLGLGKSGHGLELARGTQPHEGLLNFGAFKGKAISSFGALLRLLWAVVHQPASPFDFPSLLLKTPAPRRYLLECAGDGSVLVRWYGLVAGFLSGTSAQLLGELESNLPRGSSLAPFQTRFFQADLDLLEEFFLRGPKRNDRLWRNHGLPGALILQEELDDLWSAQAMSS